MGELSLDLGPGRAVVGGAIGVGLAGAGSGQLVLVGDDGDGAASRCTGREAGSRAGRAEAGLAVVAVAWIGVVRWAGQVTVSAARSMWNWSL
jgi:hypothetical protein